MYVMILIYGWRGSYIKRNFRGNKRWVLFLHYKIEILKTLHQFFFLNRTIKYLSIKERKY